MTSVSRARIMELAAQEGCATDDPGTREALECSGSADVQAAPGSGKTTVVATKIVALIDAWQGSGGICVLSHTNVAHEEIRRRLSRSTIGRRALGSPHFIGTIQSFTNTFLALPFLSSIDLAVERIDDEAFESIANAEFTVAKYPQAFAWQSRKVSGRPTNIVHSRLEYIGDDELSAGGQPLGLKDRTKPAYRQFLALKEAISKRGIFRYADMFHFAQQYLKMYPWIGAAIRRRFPYVMIDEMQDTDSMQAALLELLFPPALTTIQRFGDQNQAIFGDKNDGGESIFPDPARRVIRLGSSRRFGPFVARVISTIAPMRQTVLGTLPWVGSDGKHTIFLFDESSIGRVVPEFAKLVNDELAWKSTELRAAAIGYKRQQSDSPAFPGSIGDYAYGGKGSVGFAVSGRWGLRLRVERARSTARRSHTEGVAEAMKAIRALISLWSPAANVTQALKGIRSDLRGRKCLGGVVRAMLAGESDSAATWNAMLQPLGKLLKDHLGEASPEARAFAKFYELDDCGAQPEVEEATDLPVDVEVTTIHSVKGQTHDATLVLETHHFEHDLRLILPYLANPALEPKGLSTRATMHHRRLFVAMSRPRHLLCLAIAADHVDEATREALVAQGWALNDLSA